MIYMLGLPKGSGVGEGVGKGVGDGVGDGVGESVGEGAADVFDTTGAEHAAIADSRHTTSNRCISFRISNLR